MGTTAKGAWEELQNVHASMDKQRKFSLLKQLYRLDMVPGSSLIEHERLFDGLVESLAAMGKTMETEEVGNEPNEPNIRGSLLVSSRTNQHFFARSPQRAERRPDAAACSLVGGASCSFGSLGSLVGYMVIGIKVYWLKFNSDDRLMIA